MKVWNVGDKVAAADLNGNFTLAQPTKIQAGAEGWLESLVAHTEAISTVTALSSAGQAGVVAGTRTSDDIIPGYAESAFALAGFAINDNTAVKKTAYGLYLEGRRFAGTTGYTFAFESGALNLGDSNFITPFGTPEGATMLWRGKIISAGSNVTCIASFIGIGTTRYNSGFVFQNDCIGDHPSIGKPIIMDMCYRQTLAWHNATDGTVVSTVGSTSVSSAGGGGFHLIGTNTGATWLNNSNAGWTLAGTTITGAGNVTLANGLTVTQALTVTGTAGFASKLSFYAGMATGGLVNVASDAAAATAGVALNEVYINSATGAMTVRRT